MTFPAQQGFLGDLFDDFRSPATEERSDAGTMNGTSDTEIIAAPDRKIKVVNRAITIHNPNAGVVDAHLKIKVGGTTYTLANVELSERQSLVWEVGTTLDDPDKSIVASTYATHSTALDWSASWDERKL